MVGERGYREVLESGLAFCRSLAAAPRLGVLHDQRVERHGARALPDNCQSQFHEFTGELTSKVDSHYLSRTQWLKPTCSSKNLGWDALAKRQFALQAGNFHKSDASHVALSTRATPSSSLDDLLTQEEVRWRQPSPSPVNLTP